MHHYPFHIGDYRSGCINFTQLERWVYRDLLDVCYDTESPLPSDHTILFRLVGARTPEHQEAVLNVIGDKFVKTENGYENVRVQSEISKYHKKADAARNANKMRWASDADLKSDADQILTKNQEPRTNNQELTKTQPSPSAPDGFLEFWKSWPSNPRKGGRSECLKLWLKNKLEQVSQDIIAHVNASKQTKQWKDDGGQYIPAPAVYLRGRRWDGAEIEESRPKSWRDDPRFKGAVNARN